MSPLPLSGFQASFEEFILQNILRCPSLSGEMIIPFRYFIRNWSPYGRGLNARSLQTGTQQRHPARALRVRICGSQDEMISGACERNVEEPLVFLFPLVGKTFFYNPVNHRRVGIFPHLISKVQADT
jgi:hypothetical protein